MRSVVALGSMLALTACGGGGSSGTITNTTATANAVDYEAEVAALPEGQKRGVFFRALRDADLDCQEVTQFATRDRVEGKAAWDVKCSNGRAWVVLVDKGGTAIVYQLAK